MNRDQVNGRAKEAAGKVQKNVLRERIAAQLTARLKGEA